MYTFVCDTGINHFCFIVFENNNIVEFNVLHIKDKNALYSLLQRLSTDYYFDKVIIERAYAKNTKGLVYVAVIDTFFKCFADHNKRMIDIRAVHAGDKFKRLNVDIKDTSTRERKRKSIEIGRNVIFNEKKFILSDAANDRYQQLKKYDDFYDCILMYYVDYKKL